MTTYCENHQANQCWLKFSATTVMVIALLSLPTETLSDDTDVKRFTLVVSEGTDDKTGLDEINSPTVVGINMYLLNYERNLNYFFSGHLMFPSAVKSEDSSLVREISETSEIPTENESNVKNGFSGASLNGGWSYNLKSFDNVLLFAGPAFYLGSKVFENEDGNLYKMSASSIGISTGIAINLGQLILGSEYNSVTEGTSFSFGYILNE